MTLQRIRIANIKGIQGKTFDLNIIPNKPSIVYAPNGYGKSSLAIAFGSLSNSRIALHKDNFHEHDEANQPLLELTIERADNTVGILTADSNSNTISPEIDCFTITGQVKAKGIPLKFGGRTNVTAALSVDSINLIDNIPNSIQITYNIANKRAQFGANGKILPNLNNVLNNIALIKMVATNCHLLDRMRGKRVQDHIDGFRNRINAQQGTTEQLLDWIDTNELATLDAIEHLAAVVNLLMPLDLGFTRRSQRILTALELYDLYVNDPGTLKALCKRRIYENEKQGYITSFRAFNATWKDIRPKEKNGKLVLEFPNANHISNGQRDILCLVGLLEQAKRKLQKNTAILIIDEVFDYLDEANLVAAQYYITEFIDDFKKKGKRIYPLILTHLDPGLFRNYLFSKMKIYYMDQRTASVSNAIMRLLQLRDDPTIGNDVARYLLHYHTGQINKRAEFQALGLRSTWGESNNFKTYVDGHIQLYITNQPGYDPFAVCCAVRRRVEELVYNQIGGAGEKAQFLSEHSTNNKLEYAERIGINVPEYYYMLGSVYNDGLHLKHNRDNFSPLAAKLENGIIRKLISDLYAATP